jgi:hypothetical protein
MNFSDHDLERWLRAACPPVEPAPPLRRLVLAAAPKPRRAGRVLRLLLPFAAGALSVFAADRLTAAHPASRESSTNVPGTFVENSTLPEGAFEGIADRAPAPAPAREESVPAPQRSVELASAPVPRIS